MAETKRVRRTPINGIRNKLSITGADPSMHYLWAMDQDDRLLRLQDQGYQFVSKDKVAVGDKRVADATPMGDAQTLKNRNGDTQYLMAIPKEWFDEDQSRKATEVDSKEESLFQNPEGLNKLKFNSKT